MLLGKPISVRTVTPKPAATAAQTPFKLGLEKAIRQGISDFLNDHRLVYFLLILNLPIGGSMKKDLNQDKHGKNLMGDIPPTAKW